MGKHIRAYADFVVTGILVMALLLAVALSGPLALRVILGLPFLLLFPGYALVAALFPRATDISGLERLALSLGLSIALTIFTVLIVNFTPWGIALWPILLSLTAVVLMASAVACYRRSRLPEHERFVVRFRVPRPGWAALSRLDKALSVALAISLVAAVGVLIYVIASPEAPEQFTEFYVLGPGGGVADYPTELAPGEDGTVLLGVANHEGEQVTYSIEVTIDGAKRGEVGPLVLADEEEWEQLVSFSPEAAGDHQKVEFRLFRDADTEAYHTLHLFVDVTE